MTPAAEVGGVALVTGGTGGLGRAVVTELLDAGAHVVVPWVAERERDAVASEIGDRSDVHLVEANLLSAEPKAKRENGVVGGAENAVAMAAELGELRSVVNLVGGFAAGERIHAEPPETLEKMLALNLSTAVNTSRAALPKMLEAGGGSIVCVGTKVAYEPFSGGAAYAISKAAVMALVRSLHAEYRDDGIRANAIVPNVIDTPANRESMPDADFGKWVRPAEIARVVRFLCSDDSSPISGDEIPVYGQS